MRYQTPNFPRLKSDFYHIDISPATTRATIHKKHDISGAYDIFRGIVVRFAPKQLQNTQRWLTNPLKLAS
jgi:hypothetical protein